MKLHLQWEVSCKAQVLENRKQFYKHRCQKNQLFQVRDTVFSAHTVWKILCNGTRSFLSFLTSHLLILLQHSRGWTCREMFGNCLAGQTQGSGRGGLSRRERLTVPGVPCCASLSGASLKQGVHMQQSIVFLGNPVDLDANDQCLRWWGWLAWKVAIYRSFPVLGPW